MEMEKVRESIDLTVDTRRMLSYRATPKGVSLKYYIESVLESIADEQEDEILLELSHETEGIASGEEKSGFINMLYALRR
jgi:hypothetical protein